MLVYRLGALFACAHGRFAANDGFDYCAEPALGGYVSWALSCLLAVVLTGGYPTVLAICQTRPLSCAARVQSDLP